MAKKVKATLKLNLPAGEATPAPPVGSSLGQYGVAIMEFCKAYNEKTAGLRGQVIPAVVTIYEDRTFTFVTKTSPTATLIKKAAGGEKGSGVTPISAGLRGQVIPAVVTIYEDRTFTFVTKTSPTATLIKKAAGVEKGSGVTPKEKAGKITRQQAREIAEQKMVDLNAKDIETAVKIIEGQARSMGIDVE